MINVPLLAPPSRLPRLDKIAALRDPEVRARRAADAAREAVVLADEARQIRDAYAMTLVRRHGARPVDVQTRMRIARNAYVRLRRRFPDSEVPDVNLDDAWHALEVATDRVEKMTARAERAREIRDAAAQEMVNAGRRPVDVVKATGLTSARVAQMRLAPVLEPV